ncbi:MFS transporter [Saccharopolyspora erythraea]|uniref:MFS transporter n=1 Tax=Saccharopolyspora erythraea TaxID=1836 RepID=UPI001BAB345F|nr:MFS transporter [Saccharopolyspora erythraea]QUH01523.1 MFS transporter [Saccharopolyspora erythraea]
MTVPAQNTPSPSRVMAIAISSAFLIGLDAMVVAPLIPAIAEDTGAPARLGGLLVSMYALLFALSAPLFGALSDRLGRRRILTIGLVVFVVGNALTGVGLNFGFLLACRAVSGLGAAMIMPSVYAMISDTHPFEQRGKAIGKVVAGLLSSSVVGVPIGSYLAYLTSWSAAFFVIAAATAVVLVLVLVLLPEMAGPSAGKPQKTSAAKAVLGMVRSAVSTPAVLFVLACTLLWAAALYGLFSNIGTFYAERFHLNEAQAGLTIMGSGAGSMAGALLGGRIADRVGKRTVMVVAALVAATGVIATPLIGDNLVLVLIAFIAWGTAVGIGQPCLTALVSELRPEIRGTALALNSSAQYLGMMLATSLAALLLERGASFVVIGVICGVCALLVLPLLAGIKGAAGTVAAQEKQAAQEVAR